MEAHELSISANEEVILKRLKEVERTPEDIIKVGSDQLQNRLLHFTTQLALLTLMQTQTNVTLVFMFVCLLS